MVPSWSWKLSCRGAQADPGGVGEGGCGVGCFRAAFDEVGDPFDGPRPGESVFGEQLFGVVVGLGVQQLRDDQVLEMRCDQLLSDQGWIVAEGVE